MVDQKDVIGQLQEENRALKKQVTSMQSELRNLNTKATKAISRLDKFDKHATEKHLDAMQERASEARNRCGVELYKNIVLVEVGRHMAMEQPGQFAELFLNMLEDMDRPYEWWAGQHEWTLGQWHSYLQSQAKKKKESGNE